jgi:hypothetical protein
VISVGCDSLGCVRNPVETISTTPCSIGSSVSIIRRIRCDRCQAVRYWRASQKQS